MGNQNKSLIQFKHLTSSNQIARIGDFSGNTIGIVVRGTQEPIRKFRDREDGEVILLAMIQVLAQRHGAREELHNEVLHECKRILTDKFSMLGLEEVGEAFRMGSCGELKGIKVQVFGGVWNAAIFGSVLGAYRDYRRGVLAAVVKSDANMAKTARAERLRVNEANLELHENFHSMVLEKGAKYRNWREVPAFWYGIAMKLGLITFESGEAQRIYAWSIGTAKSELTRQVASATSQVQRVAYEGILDVFEQGNMTHAKVISRKVSVWVKLLGGDFNQVVNEG